jgi:hypothetical protein
MIKNTSLPVLAILLFVFSSCHFIGGERIRGNGNVVTETVNLTGFSGVDVSGAADVYITQDSDYSVKVETDENLHHYLIIEVRGDVLRIKPEDNINLRPTRLKIYVSGPVFERLEASGACKLFSENTLHSPEAMSIDLSGASDVVLDINSPEVRAELSGAGSVELKGETKNLSIDGSGSTEVRCFDLKAENVSVDISGAGNAEVFASVKLDVEVSGAGDIRYKGSPAVSQHISGAGSVKKVH